MAAPQVPADVGVVFLAQEPGGDAFQGVDQLGELDLRRAVHEQVYMIRFSVEPLEVGFEVGAYPRMISSQRVCISSVNAFRRYLVTNTKWTCRL